MNWWGRFWRRGQLEEQLEKELRFHIEQHATELIARGQDPEAARKEARLALGGPEQVKESCRDARGTRWLEDLIYDARYALRTLAHQRGFAAVALATLALGTGATTIIFTLLYGVLLKPLAYADPDRLLAIHAQSPSWNAKTYGRQKLAYPDFLDLRRELKSVAIAGWFYGGGTVSSPGDADHVDNFPITSNLFDVLGVRLLRGRAFLPQEDSPGGAPVMILGYSFAQRKFGSAADAIGAHVVYDDKPYTVVGVAPANFRLEDNEADTLTPLGQDTAPYLRRRGPHPINVAARLKVGASAGQAQAELNVLARQLAIQFPDTNADRTFITEPTRVDVGDAGSTLWLLFGAVGLVLLIACANIASLLLARALSKQRDLAMRAALGGSRGRLVRQCLTESAVLSLLGGTLGVILATFGARPFVTFWPGSLPRMEDVQLDWHVLLFALGVATVSGLLFGLAPALRIRTDSLERVLRAGSRNLVGSSRRTHSGFVVAEIALAVVLLMAATMLARTLLHLSRLSPGFDIHNVLVSRMALSPATLTNPALSRATWKDILDRTQQIPGVEAAATVDTVPMRQGVNELGYWTNAAIPAVNKLPIALATTVSPDYLNVMRIPLLEGRFFDDRDRLSSPAVIVVDEFMAQHAFGTRDAVGKRLWIPDMAKDPVLIVGVIGHVRHWGLAADDQAPVRDQFYYPFAQVPDSLVRAWSELTSLAVRTRVDPLSLAPVLRRQLRGETGDQVLYETRTMEQLARGSLARQRFLMLLFGVFASMALLLACVGVYGVLAYLTQQRIPEIGLRLALGASCIGIQWMFLRESLRRVLIGVGIGALGAIAAARVLESSVAGMQRADIATFGITILVLVSAASVASFLPARRASKVDPAVALRADQ